jgi:pyruvate ferredoxin oxidoreductase delta subunit
MVTKQSKACDHTVSLPVTKPTLGAAGKTGTWRIFRPVVNEDKKCSGCLLCWTFCPEGCVDFSPDGHVKFNLVYCKGCGICATECRLGVITMQREDD